MFLQLGEKATDLLVHVADHRGIGRSRSAHLFADDSARRARRPGFMQEATGRLFFAVFFGLDETIAITQAAVPEIEGLVKN